MHRRKPMRKDAGNDPFSAPRDVADFFTASIISFCVLPTSAPMNRASSKLVLCQHTTFTTPTKDADSQFLLCDASLNRTRMLSGVLPGV